MCAGETYLNKNVISPHRVNGSSPERFSARPNGVTRVRGHRTRRFLGEFVTEIKCIVPKLVDQSFVTFAVIKEHFVLGRAISYHDHKDNLLK